MSRTEELQTDLDLSFCSWKFAGNVSRLETRMVEPHSICVEAVEVAGSPMVVEAKQQMP